MEIKKAADGPNGPKWVKKINNIFLKFVFALLDHGGLLWVNYVKLYVKYPIRLKFNAFANYFIFRKKLTYLGLQWV